MSSMPALAALLQSPAAAAPRGCGAGNAPPPQPPSRRQRRSAAPYSHTASPACRDRLANGARADAVTAVQCSRREPPQPGQQASYSQFDDLPDAAAVHIFGVCHNLDAQHAAAEFIWRRRPAVVAVETAITAQHGAQTGSMLSAGNYMAQQADFRLRMLCQIAAQLDTSQAPETSTVWQVGPFAQLRLFLLCVDKRQSDFMITPTQHCSPLSLMSLCLIPV